MEYIIETNNIEKKYNKFIALDNLNLKIKKGDIYGLIGKNGAGKTTLIRILCGLQKPTGGSYNIYGISNNDKNILDARKKIGAIVETPSIYLDMSAKENMKMQYDIIGIPSYDDIDDLLNFVGLKNTDKKKAKDFSLGMKQRLAIAIALSGNPDFLILDEPINGLDPEGIIEIRELILKLNKEKKITILISSHIQDELSKIATKYGFIDNGKIIKEITKNQLKEVCQKRIEIKVDNPKEFIKYLENNNKRYEVRDNNIFYVYGNIKITELVLALTEENCNIEYIKEIDESLENYFINLLGGGSNE